MASDWCKYSSSIGTVIVAMRIRVSALSSTDTNSVCGKGNGMLSNDPNKAELEAMVGEDWRRCPFSVDYDLKISTARQTQNPSNRFSLAWVKDNMRKVPSAPNPIGNRHPPSKP
ncbi:hypothetical protein PVK06_021430 [Gossypium arboreum]|uniref:Uncharacterized protein n=1 Tax=Gossypium arboreum TaxID=29729 RepID=A0ABR0PPY9_GOSAR|nr:hypothetical protein PVK06_021430 [Gossypium arboreum]